MTEKKTRLLGVRVSEGLRAALVDLARRDHRTISSYVIHVLENHVTEQEVQRPKRSEK